MFAIGDYVKLDGNGWLIKAEIHDAIGMVCSTADTITNKVSISLLGSPDKMVEMYYEKPATTTLVSLSKSNLGKLYASYSKEPKERRPRKKPKLVSDGN